MSTCTRFIGNSHPYQRLDPDTVSEEELSEKPQRLGTSYLHVGLLYAIIAILLILRLLPIESISRAKAHNDLGSYETGFLTEIRPDQETLELHEVKFYGGVIYDENGTVSLSHRPGEPDYFGPPSLELETAWEQFLKDRFIKTEPKDWPRGAIKLSDQDLVQGSWRSETSGFHALHCLNYVRKSLSPEYYTSYRDFPEKDPKHLSHSGHLKHCLNQIRQHLLCQLDMTPTPRTWRETAAGKNGIGIFHADTDQWHVCRNFDALRKWMYPLQEYHDD